MGSRVPLWLQREIDEAVEEVRRDLDRPLSLYERVAIERTVTARCCKIADRAWEDAFEALANDVSQDDPGGRR